MIDVSITKKEYSKLYKECLRLTPPTHPQFSEDIAHNAILYILSTPDWRNIFVSRRIIYRAVVNGTREILGDSRRKCHPRMTLLTDNHVGSEWPEEFSGFKERIKKLKPREYAMLHLKFVWGMTNREIGEVLRISSASVECYVSLILKSLKQK